jgi:hypothetical protein
METGRRPVWPRLPDLTAEGRRFESDRPDPILLLPAHRAREFPRVAPGVASLIGCFPTCREGL